MTKIKVGHFSDAHLGYRSGQMTDKSTGVNLREQDGYTAFHSVVDEMIKHKVDVVICSGDIFHSPTPSIRTIVECQKGLSKLADAGIPFYNIAGNHDATDSIRDIPSNRALHIPQLNINSYVEPYIVKEIAPNIFCHFVSHHGYTEQTETMKQLEPIPNKFNILVTHGSVFDTALNLVLHTENEPREIVIPEEIMNKNWDYTLLGHIHERGWVNSTDRQTDTSNRKQFYGGSLIRRGFTDKPCKLGRGWTLWSIDSEEKTMTPQFFSVAQRPQYDILVFCDNKNAEEITEDLNKQLSKIKFNEVPIVRVTFIDLKKSVNTTLNWNTFKDITKKCLSFSTKIKTKEEIKKEIDNYTFSYDLLTAYAEYWKLISPNVDNEFKEDVEQASYTYLKKGQDKVVQ